MSGFSLLPFVVIMAGLAVLSACFSAAEAAFFSLRRQDIEKLVTIGWAGRLASSLVRRSEDLLTAILFSNLLVNLAYFTISSVITLQCQRQGALGHAGIFATTSILVLIFFSELLPKSLAAVRPVPAAILLAGPIYMAVRLTRPLLPVLRGVAIGIRRVFWPGFRPEPFLRVRELEMAMRFSQEAAAVLEDEQHILENLVQLSDLHAEDVMQPRTEVRFFRSPLTLEDAHKALAPQTYLFIVDQEDEAFTLAVSAKSFVKAVHRGDQSPPQEAISEHEAKSADSAQAPAPDLTSWADSIIYVPWNLSAAQVLQKMSEERLEVAAVVNEYGETVGVITLEDLLSRIFSRERSRSEQFFGRRPILAVAPGIWHVTGLTSIQRLRRYFGLELPQKGSHTVAGIFQEQLGRLPKPGDVCQWGPFELRAIQVGRRGVILAELRHRETATAKKTVG